MKKYILLFLPILTMSILLISSTRSSPIYAIDCNGDTNCEACQRAGETNCTTTNSTNCNGDSKCEVCQGAGLANCQDTTKGASIDNTIKTVVNLLSIMVGVVSVVMIIIGGLKYITSAGDTAKVTAAKNTILYALIGLVIVALAQIIVHFVINKVNETPVTPAPTAILRLYSKT